MLVEPKRAMERKFRIAIGLLSILGVVAWFTLGFSTVQAFGRTVEIRLIVLIVLGTFVFRMVMARWAESIRQDKVTEDE